MNPETQTAEVGGNLLVDLVDPGTIRTSCIQVVAIGDNDGLAVGKIRNNLTIKQRAGRTQTGNDKTLMTVGPLCSPERPAPAL